MEKAFLAKQRVLITGGTGFIGSHLLEKILAQNPSEVKVLSYQNSSEFLKDSLETVEFSRFKDSADFIKQILDFEPDYLFLLGGNSDPRFSVNDPIRDFELNVFNHLKLLEAIKQKELQKIKIIYTSSVAVYGSNECKDHSETSFTNPDSPYGVSKLAFEKYLRVFCKLYGLKGFSIRVFSTYGARLRKQVVYDFINRLLENPHKLELIGDGQEIRDLTYIDDQIQGILALTENGDYKGEAYNIGSGTGTKIIDLAYEISKQMNLTPEIVCTVNKTEKHHGKIWIADIRKALALGYKPQINLEEGLKKTIQWVKSQKLEHIS
jgi:nucleoside-diphosphate-sugar epimerase